MKRLLLFALVIAAAWYGYNNYRTLLPAKANEVVLVNNVGRAIERVRVSVPSQTVVVEVLEPGATVRRPLSAGTDGRFHVVWATRGIIGEREWHGGTYSHGPQLSTHSFEFRPDGTVLWTGELKASR